MKRLPLFFVWILPVSYWSRVRSRFTAACPLASFVTCSVSHMDKGHMSLKILFDMSSSPWHNASKGTRGPVRAVVLKMTWFVFSRGCWKRFFHLLLHQNVHFYEFPLLRSLPWVARTFRKFESKTFYSTVPLLQYHWYQYPLSIKARPPNGIAELVSSIYMVLGLWLRKKRGVNVYLTWFRNGMFQFRIPMKNRAPLTHSPPGHSLLQRRIGGPTG